MVSHDSGGLIARHALVGDPRLRAMVLLDIEQPAGLSLRFRSFLAARHLPGFGPGLGCALARSRVRRLPFVLGGAFADPRMLDGEFDEFFLRPLHRDATRRDAAVRLLRSFDPQHVRDLPDLHARIDTPVQLIWGAEDAFFPLRWAEQMVATFPRAALEVVWPRPGPAARSSGASTPSPSSCEGELPIRPRATPSQLPFRARGTRPAGKLLTSRRFEAGREHTAPRCAGKPGRRRP